MSRVTALKTILMVGVCAFACSGVFGAGKSHGGGSHGGGSHGGGSHGGGGGHSHGSSSHGGGGSRHSSGGGGHFSAGRSSGGGGHFSRGGAVEDLAAGGRRDIRRRVGRLAGLMAAGRHGSLADIPRGHTAEGVTGARAVAMADTTAATAARGDLATAAGAIPTGAIRTSGITVGPHTAETAADRMPVRGRDRAELTATLTETMLMGIRVRGAAVTARLGIVAIPG